MDTIQISVIIPVYNSEKFLRACLDSVRGQTLRDIEIICVDDGSTDGSPDILGEVAGLDPRVRVLKQENSGSGKARNLGMASSCGRYIAFMDSDDYYPAPTVLEHMLRAADTNHALICGGGMAGDARRGMMSGKLRGGTNCYNCEGFIEYSESQVDYGYYRYLFDACLLKDNGIIFPDYLRFQDPPFFVRAMIAAGRYYALTEDTYCYRFGHQSINWNFRRVNDLARGLTDNLTASREHELWMLHERCVYRVNREYDAVLYRSLLDGNIELLGILSRFQQNIDWTHVSESVSACHVIAPLGKLLREAALAHETGDRSGLKVNTSEPAGLRALATRVLRKIRGGIKCWREHGLIYTIKCVLGCNPYRPK